VMKHLVRSVDPEDYYLEQWMVGLTVHVGALSMTDLRFSHSETEKRNSAYILNRRRSMFLRIEGWIAIMH
jgi:hypothetical protein